MPPRSNAGAIGRAFVADPVDERYDSDDALHVARAQAGDGEAFTVLVRKYSAMIYGIVYRMCGAGPDVEDLGQDVFIRALTGLGRFNYQGQAGFRVWLCRIAVNVCINELRRRDRRGKIEGSSLDETISTETGEIERSIPDHTTMPHTICEARETRRIAYELLAGMPPLHKAVLTLVDVEGLSYEEAAEAVECHVGTLKSRLSRARRTLGRRYRQYIESRPNGEDG